MKSLRSISVELGPYNVATCNCHHAALAVYNACAREVAQVPCIPNEWLTASAWYLRTYVGFDVATSQSTASQSMVSRSDFRSASVSAVDRDGALPCSSIEVEDGEEDYEEKEEKDVKEENEAQEAKEVQEVKQGEEEKKRKRRRKTMRRRRRRT